MMSLTTGGAERAKYGYLLQLSQDQIQALESDDLYGFDRILAAKRTLIESLRDARGLIAGDPALATIVQHIQDSDKAAQRLLYRKVGAIMRQMSELQQQTKARRAYQQSAGRGASPVAQFAPSAPRFVDQKF